MEYTKHDPENFGYHLYSACAMLNGTNGEKLVAVLGGSMQLWNPDNGSVKPVSSPVTGSNNYGPSMISVNHGKELILYEAYETYGHTNVKGIWKYFQSNDTWTKIGEMFTPRKLSVVLPVTGMNCP